MDFFDLVRDRRSVRAYQRTPVEPEQLEKVLEAANQAPSAGNLQAYQIYLARSDTTRALLAQAAGGQGFLTQAPVVLVFCADPGLSTPRYGRRGAELYCLQDATIACSLAMLAATALGLGTVWVGAFDPNAVRSAIQAPAEVTPVAILPLGHPGETPRHPARRPFHELVHEVS
ncbi:MAG: nitroreductase family protein [Anaerolineales bacterium]